MPCRGGEGNGVLNLADPTSTNCVYTSKCVVLEHDKNPRVSGPSIACGGKMTLDHTPRLNTLHVVSRLSHTPPLNGFLLDTSCGLTGLPPPPPELALGYRPRVRVYFFIFVEALSCATCRDHIITALCTRRQDNALWSLRSMEYASLR